MGFSGIAVRFRTLLLFCSAAAWTSSAQAQMPSQPLGLVTCQATAGPPVVRAEGISELVGDILLTCINTPSLVDPGVNTIVTNLSVSLSVNITNNVGFGGSGDVTDAVVIVNENNCLTPSETGSQFGGCGATDSRFQDPQFGRLAANNRVEWQGFSLPVPGTPANPGGGQIADCTGETGPGGDCFPFVTTVRITSLRANVSQLGVPGSGMWMTTSGTVMPISLIASSASVWRVASSSSSILRSRFTNCLEKLRARFGLTSISS